MTVDTDTRLKALEQELRLLRDERDIQRLILSYGPRVDSADSDAPAEKVAEMWVEDGVYDVGGMTRQEGRVEIASTYRARHYANILTGIAHVMGSPIIELDGDTATAFNYTAVFRPETPYPQTDRFYPWRVAVNQWRLVRTTEGWRVAERINRLITGDAEARQLVQQAATRAEEQR